jgi:hypothetical protein
MHRLPNLLIAGVSKSGTSSLAWYLGQHPDICLGDRKEINYFRSLRYDQPLGSLEEYARHFSTCGDERFRLDASPSYFFATPQVIGAVEKVLPEPRALIILRDPVDRFWSSYRSMKDRRKLDPSVEFRQWFETCREVHASGRDRLREHHHHRSLGIGRYAEFTEDWLEAFGDRLRILFFEQMVAEPAKVVADVCERLGLDSTPVQAFDYTVRNVTIHPRSRALSALTRRINLRVDRYFRAYPEAKDLVRRAYKAVNASSQREVLAPADRAAVQEFYEPANRELFHQLTRYGYTDLPTWVTGAA